MAAAEINDICVYFVADSTVPTTLPGQRPGGGPFLFTDVPSEFKYISQGGLRYKRTTLAPVSFLSTYLAKPVPEKIYASGQADVIFKPNEKIQLLLKEDEEFLTYLI